MLQGVTRCNMVLRLCRVLHGITGCYMVLKGVIRFYRV